MQIILKYVIRRTTIAVQISAAENLDNNDKKVKMLIVQKQPEPEQPVKLTEQPTRWVRESIQKIQWVLDNN